ncbi:STAS domain-containing protein [Streptomyces sp. NPDC012693]|uniref:STAS domain-containing protein n=1 Tax=Streptomyces sp. NPDC012693 TaxID=3364844 RepID=UPI0036D12A32
MTTSHPDHLRLTTVDAEDRVRIELHGDLDFDNADLLLSEVTALVSGRPHLNDLHLHFGGVGMVDSMGLSVLLMIGRRTAAAGVRLHLEDRPTALDRLLHRTGTSVYFTASARSGTAEASGAAGTRASARSMGPDEAT